MTVKSALPSTFSPSSSVPLAVNTLVCCSLGSPPIHLVIEQAQVPPRGARSPGTLQPSRVRSPNTSSVMASMVTVSEKEVLTIVKVNVTLAPLSGTEVRLAVLVTSMDEGSLVMVTVAESLSEMGVPSSSLPTAVAVFVSEHGAPLVQTSASSQTVNSQV